ncbi:hypothetical protein COO60DRAFT_378265 [Scenedesmus sp. NREL 46B-D3]|nr:hypothetical protein COO60DRAFT_378265 [Scenedesmus sp. NREL 46B-D3]
MLLPELLMMITCCWMAVTVEFLQVQETRACCCEEHMWLKQLGPALQVQTTPVSLQLLQIAAIASKHSLKAKKWNGTNLRHSIGCMCVLSSAPVCLGRCCSAAAVSPAAFLPLQLCFSVNPVVNLAYHQEVVVHTVSTVQSTAASVRRHQEAELGTADSCTDDQTNTLIYRQSNP